MGNTKNSRLIVRAVEYMIELSGVEWDILDSYIGDDCINLLENIEATTGCYNIDYNGHFGRAIFFTANTEEDANKMVPFIECLTFCISDE